MLTLKLSFSAKVRLCMLFGICLLTFLPGMYYPNKDFMLDDQVAILKNTDVVNISRPLFDSLGLIMKHDFWGQDLFNKHSHKSYRPIVTMLYHLEFRIYPDLPTIAPAMRANSLSLHYCVCMVMKWTIRRILPEMQKSFASFAVLLFAVHPIHTEVIYNIVGRADILCAFCFLIAVYQYWDVMNVRNRHLVRKMMLMALLGLLCMLSKEIGIVLLPFCAVLDIINTFESYSQSRVPERRKSIFKMFAARPDLRKRIIYLAGITLFLAIIRFSAMNFEFPNFNMEENPIANHPSFWVRAFTYPYIHFVHFWLLICPDWLCFDWSHNSITPIESFSDPRILLAIILYLFLIILFIKGPRSVRIAVALIVVPFIPSSNLVSIGFVVAERVLYIPAVGYCLLISIGYHHLYFKYKMRRIITLMIMLVVVTFMLKSNLRTFDYENEYALYSSGLRVNPNNAKINYNVAKACADRADFDKAFLFGQRANMLRPNQPNTLNNLANACRRVNRHDLAIEYLKEAVRIWPNYSLGWMNLGITYSVLQRYHEALEAYLKADEFSPNNEKVLFNLGNLYSAMGDEEMSGKMYKKARDLNPERAYIQRNYLMNRADYGNLEEFIEACDHAEEQNNVEILTLVADILSIKNYHFERIESILKRIIKLNPEDYTINLRLSKEYKKRLNLQASLKYFKRALQLNSHIAQDENYSDMMKLLNEDRKMSSNSETSH